MNLFFDARYIKTDHHDGISRYTTELGNAVAKFTHVTFIICDKKQLNFLPKKADYILSHSPTSLNEPLSSLKLNKYSPDVVFSPMQTFGSFGRKFKLILSLHDMIYYHHRTPPRQLNPAIRLGWWLFHLTHLPQRIVLNNSDAVVTVSETSKKEILNANLTKRTVNVIYNAPQDLRQKINGPVIQDKKGPRNIIYVGSFMPYKNAETIIDAMKWLPNHTLHLMSKITTERKNELKKRARISAKIVFYGGFDDMQYAKLLQDNSVLVTASKCEGFGLPVVEAMAVGVPVVISDIPIFHEVGGKGALYASPDNAKDFAEKILSLNNPKIHFDLIKEGKKQVAKFSWNKSAEKLLKLAESLARN